MEKSVLAPCLSLCMRGLVHLCGSAEAEDGEQGWSHSPAISPLGFWKGSHQGLSPFSISYIQPGHGKAMPK